MQADERCFIDTTYEVTKLIKQSPRRDRVFERIKAQLTPGATSVRMLCATRWTVWAKAFKSIAENYAALQDYWNEVLPPMSDPEMKNRINGVAYQMRTCFTTFSGCIWEQRFLAIVTIPGYTVLQGTRVSTAEDHRMANCTVRSLRDQRNHGLYEHIKCLDDSVQRPLSKLFWCA